MDSKENKFELTLVEALCIVYHGWVDKQEKELFEYAFEIIKNESKKQHLKYQLFFLNSKLEKENELGKSEGVASLEDVNVLLHSKRHCFSFPEGFREIQESIVKLFLSYEPPITYTEEEVLSRLVDYDREFKLDTFIYTKPCPYTVESWFDKNKKVKLNQ